MSDREAFEEAASRLGYNLSMAEHETGEYHYRVTQDAWDIWQEAVDQAAREQEAVGFIPSSGLNNLKAGHPARIYPVGSTPSPFESSTLLYATPQPDKPEGERVKPTGRYHDLKTDSAVFCQSLNGMKPWEIRRNDRNFTKGDTVTLHETENPGSEMAQGAPLIYTGRKVSGVIGYVLDGPNYGIKDDWCVFTILPTPPADKEKGYE